MSTSPAIQQAVELLSRRHDEVVRDIATLEDELRQITNALQSLGYGNDRVAPVIALPRDTADGGSSESAAETNNAYEGMSVAAATRAVMESARGPWTPSLVRERLAGTGVQQERDDANFITAIRTAFYSMRKRGEAVMDEEGRTILKIWIDSSGDAEAPAGTGASDGEGPSDGPSGKEGGSADGAAPPVGRDGGSVRADPSHGHSDRASIVGG
jgi:hypothetical protein